MRIPRLPGTILVIMLALTLAHIHIASADAAPSGSTPTLVQSVSTSNTQGYSVNSYTVRLPNATLSGNSLVVAVQQNSGSGALSVSDDKGNAYNLAKTNDDGSQMVSMYYATNVTAGTQTINLKFPGSGADYVAAVVSEFYNVAAASALDGTSANSATSSSITAGNLTTTMDNDLIFQYAVQDGDGVNTKWTQGGSPWMLLAADYFDAQAAQYQIQAAHGAINSTFAQGSSKKFNTVAIALKAAAAGTGPSGIRIVHMGHNRVPQSPPGTFTLQTPSTGNLLVVSWIGVPGCDIGSVSDGNGNSYTSTGAPFGNGGSGDSQLYYAASATTSTTMSGPTLTVSGCSGASSNAMVYDISGAAASPYDAVAGRRTASGNQPTAGNVTTVTITPSTANGLVFTQTGVTSHTLVSVTPGNFMSTQPSPDIATGQVDNNNGWAINYNSDTSPETFVYGTMSGQLDAWASIAVAFKASGSPPPPPTFDFSLANGGNQTVVQGQPVSSTITATLLSGNAQTVSFSASGLPTGTTASFSPTSCTPNCTSTFTLATSTSTPAGSSTITVTGAAGSLSHTTTFTLTVTVNAPPSFDFSLSNGGNKTVVQGQSVSNTITATLVSGTAQSVSFSASGLPTGATASFSPASCSPTCPSTLTLTTSGSTPAGSSTIIVTGVAGSLSHTTTFTLTVTVSGPLFDFSLSNGGNTTVVQGQSVSNTITATLVSGTAQLVSFAASGLPTGAAASFSPASCSPTCSSTLMVTTAASTPIGSSTITVTGAAGSLSHTTMFTLTVNAPPAAKWTGSGNIAVSGGTAQFSFKIYRATDGSVSGQLAFYNNANGFTLTENNLLTLTVTGNKAVFTGTGYERIGRGASSGPFNFTVTVQDIGTSNDKFQIQISDPNSTVAGSTTSPILRGQIVQYY